MEDLPAPTQAASLIALRNQLHNLEETIASLFQLDLAQPEGKLREQLVDKVSELDSIADVVRRRSCSKIPSKPNSADPE